MSWVAVAIAGAAVVGAGAGMYSANKASDSAEDATQAASQATDYQKAISEELMNRWRTTFVPVENKAIESAMKPLGEQPDYLRAMGQIDRSYADTGGNLRRTMGGRYPYGAGMETGSMMGLNRSRIQTKAGATSDWNKDLFNRRLQLANVGRGMPGQALSGYGSAAGTNMGLAGMYNQGAQAGWGNVGTGMGNLAYMGARGWLNNGQQNQNMTGWIQDTPYPLSSYSIPSSQGWGYA